MLVDDAGNVWLTGFGIASQLPRERQAPAPPEIIAGTLAYMAPEQTGRMNRSIDTRSDLYSLGVTLYQMLTGHAAVCRRRSAGVGPLPHCAPADTARRSRASVPEPLSAIIMKLLAKNAEERYQTAFGLEADLRRCLAEWQSHGRIDPFPLGAHDVVGPFADPGEAVRAGARDRLRCSRPSTGSWPRVRRSSCSSPVIPASVNPPW